MQKKPIQMRNIYGILGLLILILGSNIHYSKGNTKIDLYVFTINHDSCKCNYDCWPDLKDSINGLSVKQISRFLTTISVDCRNDAEFSECSNERLFKIMELNPDNFVKAVDQYNADLEIGEIISLIKSPINDGIDLNGIYLKIQNSNVESVFKDKILNAIKYSIDLNQ